MARSPSFLPLVFGALLVGGVVVLSRTAADRVDAGLRRVAGVLPAPPDRARDVGGPVPDDPLAPLGGEPEEVGGDDGPRIDLEYPTERDWLFLQGVLRDGDPEARRSAAKALVVMGRMRGVPMLFEAARQPGPDADLYCLAALDVLRLQRWEEALPALLEVMLDDGDAPSQRCRSEVSDRFAVAGGRDAERLATLAEHEDAAVRGFVASYLADVDPDGYRDVLRALAQDPDPLVRARAGRDASSTSQPEPLPEDAP